MRFTPVAVVGAAIAGATARNSGRALRLRGWLDPAVLAVAMLAFASGVGQFGAVSGLGDIARHFGRGPSTARALPASLGSAAWS